MGCETNYSELNGDLKLYMLSSSI